MKQQIRGVRRILAAAVVLLLAAAVFCLPASAAAPADAVFYADFNNGPLPEPEGSMKASDQGGTLGINAGPINAKAELVDGALKLTLGTGGYYGMQSDAAIFRDANGKLTDYKYLVLRMKGETGDENLSPKGFLMSIGGGDGLHIGTFNSSAMGTAMPYLDPDGKTMPRITTEYRDFVIALNEDIVRPDQGRDLGGININTAASTVTIYIDEIYLTNTIPEGYVNDDGAAVAPVTPAASSAPQTQSAAGTASVQSAAGTPPTGNQAGTTASTAAGASIALIVLVAVVLVLCVALMIVVILQLAKLKKAAPEQGEEDEK